MSVKDDLQDRILGWKQGTILPGGGFGQIRAGEWLEIAAIGYGDLSSVVGESIELKFVGGVNNGKTVSTTITSAKKDNSAFLVDDKWESVGGSRVIFAGGLVQVHFAVAAPVIPDPIFEPQQVQNIAPVLNTTIKTDWLATLFPQDPKPGTIEIPAVDPLNTLFGAATFGQQKASAVAEEKKECECEKPWWVLLLVAGALWWYLQKRK